MTYRDTLFAAERRLEQRPIEQKIELDFFIKKFSQAVCQLVAAAKPLPIPAHLARLHDLWDDMASLSGGPCRPQEGLQPLCLSMVQLHV